mmetsp:Transcript_4143/g.13256  ORF Transcript_4143/g.13256 Transcript_4143/m.13256 type:complete len:252 (-) Transcript_4143:377-1132(-)
MRSVRLWSTRAGSRCSSPPRTASRTSTTSTAARWTPRGSTRPTRRPASPACMPSTTSARTSSTRPSASAGPAARGAPARSPLRKTSATASLARGPPSSSCGAEGRASRRCWTTTPTCSHTASRRAHGGSRRRWAERERESSRGACWTSRRTRRGRAAGAPRATRCSTAPRQRRRRRRSTMNSEIYGEAVCTLQLLSRGHDRTRAVALVYTRDGSLQRVAVGSAHLGPRAYLLRACLCVVFFGETRDRDMST